MRTALVAFVAALLGIAAGVGFTWAEFSRVQEVFDLPSTASPAALQRPAETPIITPNNRGRVVVENGEDFDFGSMERETERSHVFILKNEGTAAVKLETGMKTCKCTNFEIAAKTLAPGEKTEVKVNWKPISYDLNFHQRAEVVVTNDPERPVVSLTIHGHVVQNLRPDPENLLLNDVPNTEPMVRQVRIFAYYNDNLQILETRFDAPDTAEFYNVNIAPLPPAELKPEGGARSGVLATITIKPGLPLGPIHQTIRLATNDTKGTVVALPVQGKIISDLSLVGDPRYNAEQGILKLGELGQDEGAEAKLRVFVRGPQRNNVKLSLGPIDSADVLQVTIGEAKPLANATMYDLIVKIPPGARLVNHLGTTEHKLAKIVILTTHPQAPKMQLFVQFAVTP